MKVLIAGAGPAGITVAESIRAVSAEPSITILSTEPYAPYSPPAMADHFLTGRDEPLFWKGQDVASRLGLDFRPSSTAVAVRPGAHEVVLEGGSVLPYDQLVIATGSRLHAPIQGWNLPGVLDFKSLGAAERIVARVRAGSARTALIVGAGFIGMEIALLLADLGVRTTIIGRRPWLMPRMLDTESAEIAARVMSERGVTLRLGLEATAFLGDAEVEGVGLADGDVLRADLYVAATGVQPHMELLAGSGIATHWGISVDQRMHTTARDVWAAGDVVEAPDRLTGESYVHAIFPNAVAQARVVAENVMGGTATYVGAESMNSLKHLGLPLVAAGAPEGEDELRSRSGDELRRIFITGGRIAGFRLVGDIRAAGLLHALMLRRDDVRGLGRRLLDPSFSWGGLALSSQVPG
jgi:NAD(P)H-nitrite reductase large subunit